MPREELTPVLRGFVHPGSSRAIQQDPEKTPKMTPVVPKRLLPLTSHRFAWPGPPKHSSKQHHAEQPGSFHRTGGNQLQTRIPSAAQHVICSGSHGYTQLIS